MTTLGDPPAITELHHVVELLDDISSARARNLHWVIGELGRAIQRGHIPHQAGRTVRALFEAEPIAAYWQHANAGDLRLRPKAGDDQTSTQAAMQQRWDCLNILARETATPIALPPRPAGPPLKPTIPKPSRDALYRWLARQAERPTGSPYDDRVLAIVALVLATAARSGELVALRLDDFADDLTAVTITRQPHGERQAAPAVETIPLRKPIRVCVDRWVQARQQIVEDNGIRGDTRRLFIGIQATHTGPPDYQRRPAGMPLRIGGLEQAYTRAISDLNTRLAGRRGWQPLPLNLDRLRRSVVEEVGKPQCSMKGCTEPRASQGLCKPHWRKRRWAEEGLR